MKEKVVGVHGHGGTIPLVANQHKIGRGVS